MTKAQKRTYILNRYSRSDKMMVTQHYKNCSGLKIAADNRIRHEMEQLGGTRYRIISGNCQQFTCGYCFKQDDKWYLRYYTAWGHTDYELSEGEVNELYLQ